MKTQKDIRYYCSNCRCSYFNPVITDEIKENKETEEIKKVFTIKCEVCNYVHHWDEIIKESNPAKRFGVYSKLGYFGEF